MPDITLPSIGYGQNPEEWARQVEAALRQLRAATQANTSQIGRR